MKKRSPFPGAASLMQKTGNSRKNRPEDGSFQLSANCDMLFIHSSFFLRGLGEFTVRIRAILAVLFVQLCFLEELK